MLKMDMQNVIYRYFAESARCLKKIQHSIRSGEAELMVTSDGEEPRPGDLKAAFEEFLREIESFRSWTENARAETGFLLSQTLGKQASDKNITGMVLGCAAAILAVASLEGLVYCTVQGVAAAWGTSVSAALSGQGVGASVAASLGAAGIGGAMAGTTCQNSLCAGQRKTSGDVVMSSWQDTMTTEVEIVAFLRSLSFGFQDSSFQNALQRAQDLRIELDRFLQMLQKEDLIFDPCSMSSGP